MKVKLLIVSLMITIGLLTGCASSSNSIVVGAKDYTEQYVLGNLLAIFIEENTNIDVTFTSDMASDIIFAAINAGAVDVYIDYTGTIYGSYMIRSDRGSPEEIFNIVSTTLKESHDIFMFDPLGFNNSFGIAVRRDTAAEYDLKTISDLATISANFIFGGSYDILVRNDGLPNLKVLYDMGFQEERILYGINRYIALENDEIQVTEVFTTDGSLLTYDLVVLDDDMNFFPPYQGAIVIRGETLEENPQLQGLLEKLSGVLTNDIMRQLNYMVDEQGLDPRDVAEKFLRDNNLIG